MYIYIYSEASSSPQRAKSFRQFQSQNPGGTFRNGRSAPYSPIGPPTLLTTTTKKSTEDAEVHGALTSARRASRHPIVSHLSYRRPPRFVRPRGGQEKLPRRWKLMEPRAVSLISRSTQTGLGSGPLRVSWTRPRETRALGLQRPRLLRSNNQNKMNVRDRGTFEEEVAHTAFPD